MMKAHDVTAFNRMTYSIVALDRDSGEMGVAVQTCWPGVGATVPVLEPGVGAVATQSFTNVDAGHDMMALLREGLTAPAALRQVMADDPGRDLRQVGLVDAAGHSAAHTGSRCVAEAGDVCEPGVSIQANTLERAGIPLTMLDAFRGADGDLADRLLAALRAAQRDGGDIRGSQSAALSIAPGSPAAQAWDRRFDLRVDVCPRPLDELARLLRIARAYEALDAALEADGAADLGRALAGTTAAYDLAPEDAQIAFWHAMVLSANGRQDESRRVLDAALESERRLAEFGRRYAEAGHGGPLSEALASVRSPTEPR